MVIRNCPLCGSPVRIPSAEVHTRYYCKKCHTPFHLDRSGTAVVGEPPGVEVQLQEMKQQINQTLRRVPVKPILGGLAAVVVTLLAWYLFFGPAEQLDHAAQKAAQALAENDPSYLKGIAVPGTAEDVGRWFDQVHPQLVRARERWHGGKEEVVEVRVVQHDPASRKGDAAISIHPGVGALDVSLANPSAATAGADSPFDVDTTWTLNWRGRWKLDGRETYAKVRTVPSP